MGLNQTRNEWKIRKHKFTSTIYSAKVIGGNCFEKGNQAQADFTENVLSVNFFRVYPGAALSQFPFSLFVSV
jgi:hypothetical protein